MMANIRAPYLVGLTLLGVFSIIAFGGCGDAAQAAGGQSGATTTGITTTDIPDTTGTAGPVGATLKTSDGLAITLLAVDKGATRWFFHFHAINTGPSSVPLRGADMPTAANAHANQDALDRQFVIQAMPVMYAVEWRPLSEPLSLERTQHPALGNSTTLAKQGVSDGWLAVDITNVGPVPHTQVIYTFGPIASKRCPPSDPTNCTPQTLYQVLEWNL